MVRADSQHTICTMLDNYSHSSLVIDSYKTKQSLQLINFDIELGIGALWWSFVTVPVDCRVGNCSVSVSTERRIGESAM